MAMMQSNNQSSEAMKTHTSDAFVDFAYDLLEYAIPKCGLTFAKPQDYKRTSAKKFREGFGEVVLLFRNRHLEQSRKLYATIQAMERSEDILALVAEVRERLFIGVVPLMEYIVYCAFLVDITVIFSLQRKDEFLIYEIVDDNSDVFNMHIKPYFTIIGGWYALFRVAEQYAKFVTFNPLRNPCASVVDENDPVGILRFIKYETTTQRTSEEKKYLLN